MRSETRWICKEDGGFDVGLLLTFKSSVNPLLYCFSVQRGCVLALYEIVYSSREVSPEFEAEIVHYCR